MTPAQLRDEADARDAAGRAALTAGDARAAAMAFHQAQVCRLAADELERLAGNLPLTSRSPDVQDTAMTQAQLARRGRAVARAVADNPLKEAITGDARWGSLRVYADKRLGIAPSSLTGYMNGTTPCPRHVDKKVRADFPKLSWTWPRGVVD